MPEEHLREDEDFEVEKPFFDTNDDDAGDGVDAEGIPVTLSALFVLVSQKLAPVLGSLLDGAVPPKNTA